MEDRQVAVLDRHVAGLDTLIAVWDTVEEVVQVLLPPHHLRKASRVRHTGRRCQTHLMAVLDTHRAVEDGKVAVLDRHVAGLDTVQEVMRVLLPPHHLCCTHIWSC